MNTPTHMMVAVAVFARPGQPRVNAAAFIGGLFPDLGIYALWAYSKIAGISEHTVWREIYWQPPWQTLVAFGHSMPIFGGLLAVLALAGAFKNGSRLWPLAVFCMAILLHIACDFPVHVDDAHPHFWPLSDWTFHSPLSYWDHRHYGDWVSKAEIAFALVLAAIVWKRFSSPWVRATLGIAASTYVLVPLYFSMMLH